MNPIGGQNILVIYLHLEGTSYQNVPRTLHTKIKRKWREKRHLSKKKKKHVWLSGRLHIEGRLNEGPRLQRKHKDENEAKQNKRNTRERRHDIFCKPNARRAQVRHFYNTMLDGVLHCPCSVFTRGCLEGLGAFCFFFKYHVL